MNERQLIENSLQWRYAVKRFDPSRKIADGDWQVLKKSLLMAPSSYGLQPYRFLLIEDSKVRAKLRPLSWNQTQVTDASHFVVLLARDQITEADVNTYMTRIQEVRGVTRESLAAYENLILSKVVKAMSVEDMRAWAQRQVYIAMGFLLSNAALLKIDSTPIEGLEPAGYDEVLGLAGSGYKTVAAVALGYRHAEDSFQTVKKVRRKETDLLSVL